MIEKKINFNWQKMSEKFKCKKCGKSIGEHNQYLHDAMCDDCFFEVYFPESYRIYETDVNKLPKICKLNEREDMKFWEFLKSGDFDQERFNKIVKEMEKKIDCTKCRNCCRMLGIVLENDDINRISKYLNLTKEDFISRYLMRNKLNDFEFKDKPCIFLVDNECQIFEVRPEGCRGYPHLDKDVTWRCIQFFSNAEVCPIVFNVLQNAKEEFLEDMYDFENPDI
jgi:Fe-S-cluster containining protein